MRRLKLKLFLIIGNSKIIYKMIKVLTVEHCDGNALYIADKFSLSLPNIFFENPPKKYEIDEKKLK